MLFDAFDSIRILNLPHRTDRRGEMMRELARVGLKDDPRVSFFDSFVTSDQGCFGSVGAHGCFLSHLAVLRQAVQSKHRVLILEDDCEFTGAARQYVLPKEWDIFYGGFEADDPENPHDSNIIGAHCMGYSLEAARKAVAYLERLMDPGFPPDAKAAAEGSYADGIKPPFDGAIVWFRRAHPELRTVFAQVAVQRSSRSDIAERRMLDRLFPYGVAAARKIRNRMRALSWNRRGMAGSTVKEARR